MKKTLVINFFAGPGAGKSSMATGLFSYLKFKGINAEYISEYAKDIVWENSNDKLNNQFYISAKQFHRQWRLLGKVDVIVTDSPIILGCFYGASNELNDLLVKEFNSDFFDNLNIFVTRIKDYNPKGRTQTESQAKELDSEIKNFLLEKQMTFQDIDGSWKNIPFLGDIIIKNYLTSRL